MLNLQRHAAPFPHEQRSGPIRMPIPGRLDNIPRAMPPIMQQLTRERLESGRVGHFSSRRPLLGVTADQEGSIPMPMPSTTPMFPAPMPADLYNHPRDVIENEDWQLQEGPLLTSSASHVEFHRRLHQDRGNYRRPVNADEIGEQEITFKPPHTDWATNPEYLLYGNRAPIENRIGFSSNVSQANIGRGPERYSITRDRKGGEYVNNRGAGPRESLVEHGLGIQSDHRPSLFVEWNASGNRLNTTQSNIVREGANFLSRKLNSTIDTHVSFGPDLYLDFAADRFQKTRNHLFDHRPEMKSDPALNEINNKGPKSLFDRPITRGRDYRVTVKDELQNVGRADVGKAIDTMRDNPYYNEPHHFYGKLSMADNTKSCGTGVVKPVSASSSSSSRRHRHRRHHHKSK